MKLEFLDFIKIFQISFHEYPSRERERESRIGLYGHTDGRTDMTKLTVAIRNFAKAPKNTTCIMLKCLSDRKQQPEQ
jgi:hypothetical protein